MEKPEYYIETFYEIKEGFKFEQPIQRLNGKSIFEYDENSFERQNWGKIYWDSRKFNDALDYSRYDSDLWTEEKAKNKAFDKIYRFIMSGKSGTGSSVTPLFNFEIFLMNDGFEMISFCELNAINTGFSIIFDKIIGDEIINPKGIRYSRSYLKQNVFVCLGFGIEFNEKKTNFYFQTSKSNHFFQIDNSYENYKKAIEGQLPALDK